MITSVRSHNRVRRAAVTSIALISSILARCSAATIANTKSRHTGDVVSTYSQTLEYKCNISNESNYGFTA